ncbi:hypothetical protein ACFLZ7_01850 [Nanoarchaeota archaeon]
MPIISYFLELLASWGSLFAAPFTNPRMLWIILPIYFIWIFTEFYQEKKGTSLGNAVSNGVVVLWIGIDWVRQIVDQVTGKTLSVGTDFFTKVFIAFLIFVYGALIMVNGIRGKALTRFIGRIREVTYAILMLTPIFYGAIGFSFKIVFSMILFFPLFYGLVELVDRYAPTPQTYEAEEKFEKEVEEKKEDKELEI